MPPKKIGWLAGPELCPLALRCLGAFAVAWGADGELPLQRPEIQQVLKTWMRCLVKIMGSYGIMCSDYNINVCFKAFLYGLEDG